MCFGVSGRRRFEQPLNCPGHAHIRREGQTSAVLRRQGHKRHQFDSTSAEVVGTAFNSFRSERAPTCETSAAFHRAKRAEVMYTAGSYRVAGSAFTSTRGTARGEFVEERPLAVSRLANLLVLVQPLPMR